MPRKVLWHRRPKTIFERNKFFAITTLEGFRYIQRSNSRFEVIVWYLVNVTFIYLTVHSIIALSDQFLSQPPMSKVTIGRVNNTYDIKVFKLRIRLGLPELNPEFHIQDPHSWRRRIWNANIDGVRYTPYNVSLEREVDAALRRIKTRENFFKKHWNYVLLPLLSRYSFFVTSCEFFSKYCNEHFHSQLEYRTMIDPEFAVIREQIYKVIKHARRLGVTEKQLFDEFGRQLLRWIRFEREPDIFPPEIATSQGVMPSYETEGNVLFLFELKPTKPIVVGLGPNSGLCFRVNLYPFLKVVHKSGILGPKATTKQAYELYLLYQPKLYVQFGIDNRRQLSSQLGEISYWTIEVKSAFRSMSNCLEGNSRHTCTHNCTSFVIEQHCNCSTVLIENPRNNSLPWCTPKYYKSCLGNISDNIFPECANDCPSDCDVDFMDVLPGDNGPLRPTAMELCFNVMHRELPIFEEHDAKTWQNFLADLGRKNLFEIEIISKIFLCGAVDLWLGACVLEVLHLIIYLVKQMVYLFRTNTKTGIKARQLSRAAQKSIRQRSSRRPSSPVKFVSQPPEITYTNAIDQTSDAMELHALNEQSKYYHSLAEQLHELKMSQDEEQGQMNRMIIDLKLARAFDGRNEDIQRFEVTL